MEGEHVDRTEEVVAVETDRGLFDHSKGKKKDEEEKLYAADLEKPCDGEEAGDKPVHVPVVHHEPVPVSVVHHEPVPSEEKRGMMDKIKDKVSPAPPHVAAPPPVEAEEPKKGPMEKIKDKLPGQKKPEEAAAPPPEVVAEEQKKKGMMDKIKEKLPGHHPKGPEEVNIKE